MALPKTPPDDEATINVTTGSNHIAVIVSKECLCCVILVRRWDKHLYKKRLTARDVHGVNPKPTANEGNKDV